MPGTEVGRKVTAARQIDTRVRPKCQEGDFWSRDLNLGIRVKRLLEGHSKDKLAQGESVGGGVQRRALRARGGRGARPGEDRGALARVTRLRADGHPAFSVREAEVGKEGKSEG